MLKANNTSAFPLFDNLIIDYLGYSSGRQDFVSVAYRAPLRRRHRPHIVQINPHTEPKMKDKIETLLTSSTLVVFLLVGGCGKQSSTTESTDPDAPSQEALIAKVDKHGDEVMASTARAEAREWMKQPKHIFFKADPKEVAGFVEEFYGAGATQVLIVDIEEDTGNQYGESLLVVLPKDATVRAKLFEIGSRADTAFQEDPVSDKGQKYLYYSLD
jgi:hypothetical protein